MSHIVSIRTEIKDLKCFAKACQLLGMVFDESKMRATLTDTSLHGRLDGSLQETSQGVYTFNFDNDPRYSALPAIIGTNGEKLVCAYAEAKVLDAAERSGYFLESRVQQKDGSIVLTILA